MMSIRIDSKIILILSIIFVASCRGHVYLAPLPAEATMSEKKYFVEPIKITDQRMTPDFRENGISIYQKGIEEKLKKMNKLAINKVEADYILVLIVEKYYKRNAEKYMSPFSSGPKSDHMETLVLVNEAASGKELSRGRIFYRDSSIFGSLNSMIRNSIDEIVKNINGKSNK